ncbi:Uncharacterized conserved protein YlxW, UPF0749 family [Tindallia californiensis]|uniref:Uncharacterized conserved protein YlxW, UPF0749 family n=2 Tax=Tindallia californiensis TaxID=159292 RepID=A0A1H3JPH8_9FIRM|nr:Uncharacterized conserved protein YlxW, UPF0749 family [Tindallia californiensis]
MMQSFFGKSMLLVISILIGLILAIQVKNLDDDYRFISVKTISDLNAAIRQETEEIDHLKELIDQQEKRLREYQFAIASEGSIDEILIQDIEHMRMRSGHYDLEGPGVIVVLMDSERELYKGENPNNVIVHDEDVLRIVNDLKIAGAEALSINGQRYLNTSEIQCTGPTITINQMTYAQPFVIKAIGNPDTLNAAIKAPGTYSREIKEVFGIQVESHVSERIRIPKFQGDFTLHYVTAKDGEDQ